MANRHAETRATAITNKATSPNVNTDVPKTAWSRQIIDGGSVSGRTLSSCSQIGDTGRPGPATSGEASANISSRSSARACSMERPEVPSSVIGLFIATLRLRADWRLLRCRKRLARALDPSNPRILPQGDSWTEGRPRPGRELTALRFGGQSGLHFPRRSCLARITRFWPRGKG